MRKLVFPLLLALFCHFSYGQTSSIKGIARDTAEKRNLQNAVVSVLNGKDSVLLKFTRSDRQGAFRIGGLLPGDYVLMISFPKFADYAEKISLGENETDLGLIPLTPKSLLLSEVVIRTNAAIRIKGDTTEFAADSFKVREGATVEELLRQLPGISVNSKGEITSQGKRVDKVLVDGEEFFGEDPTIATQNIGAKAVDRVQVFDTKTEQDQLKGISGSGEGNKTINIKLKEDAKKGHFGRVEGGTDFNRLVNGKLMFNKFRGNRKASVFGTKSNINTGSLGWEDRNKLGIEEDYEFDELSGFYYSFGDGENEFNDWSLRGIPNAWSAGTLFSDKWNEEKNKVNLSYLYNRLATENTTITESQTLLKDTTFFNNSVARTSGLSQRHALNGKYEWKIDSFSTLKLSAAGAYKLKDTYTAHSSQALDENLAIVNDNNRTNELRSTKKQLDNLVTYRRSFRKKDRLLIATFRLGLIEDDQSTLLKSTTNFYKGGIPDSIDFIDQQKIFTGQSTTVGTKITYNEPIGKGWNLVGEYSLNSNVSSSHRNSFEKDAFGKYTDRNDLFSNNSDLTAMSNSGTITARYQGSKLRAVIGTGLSLIRLDFNNLDEQQKTNYRFTGLTPQAQLGYKIKPQTGFNLYYRGNTVQPTITQLQPLRNNSDPLSEYIGNPDLKVGFNHNMGISFNDFKVLKSRYLYGSLSTNLVRNAIVNYSTVDSFGKRTYQPVNVNGNWNWFFWGIWQSGQGDKKLNHEIQPQANGGHNVNFLNGEKNVNSFSVWSLTYRIRYSVQEKYNFSVGPMIRRNISRSSLRPDADNNYWNYGGRADGYVMLPWKLELSSDVDFNLQGRTDAFARAANIIVWNAEFSRRFLKNKDLKIALVAHDILNQNIGLNRVINSNFINEERFDRLARYFLLNVSWTFNKMPGKN